MTFNEINDLFYYLNKKFNKSKDFYFKIEEHNQIGMYLKFNDKRIARFYANAILLLIRG